MEISCQIICMQRMEMSWRTSYGDQLPDHMHATYEDQLENIIWRSAARSYACNWFDQNQLLRHMRVLCEELWVRDDEIILYNKSISGKMNTI